MARGSRAEVGWADDDDDDGVMAVVGIGGLDVDVGAAGAEGSASASGLAGEGGDEGRLDTIEGTEVPGGGAPLTIWSSLEPDMVRVRLV